MTTRSLTSAKEQAITWERFKELLEEEFFPTAIKDQKEMEFLRLQQGTMTLVEYERKFEELSRFAPHLVDMEEKWARRLEHGLQPYIHDIVLQVQNFSGKRKLNFDRQNNGNNAPKKGKTEIVGAGGHFAKECPQNQTQKAGDDKKGKARVFSLSKQEAERDPNVLAEISLSSGKILVADQIARNLKMRIDGRGIARMVIFRRSGEKEFHFVGTEANTLSPIVSTTQVERTPKKELGQRFLVSMTNIKRNKLSTEDVRIVQHYKNVFLKDFLGVPPDRQVEFTIDLVPGAVPISKAPYHMVPLEL
ncbi:uncharacterized protein LOC111390277 [Olea europaea var. sylvestris]|uniref:uncharacterized protein LOC111390277 n=1 Tax=Olea europaea var. sylvestris TaxID=158386 RepID=UPI000C1CD510|nr:uncharacterized protein LOC111390277 [Olea europaea var. sylvestris]